MSPRARALAAQHGMPPLHPLVERVRTLSRGDRIIHRCAAICALRVEQRGRCAVCGDSTDLQLDHDHESGLVRGLLCRQCNVRDLGARHHPSAWAKYVANPPAAGRFAYVSSAGDCQARRSDDDGEQRRAADLLAALIRGAA